MHENEILSPIRGGEGRTPGTPYAGSATDLGHFYNVDDSLLPVIIHDAKIFLIFLTYSILLRLYLYRIEIKQIFIFVCFVT